MTRKQTNNFETARKPAILFSTNLCLLQIFRTFAQDINTITIMTAMQLRLNSELFGALQVISEDEGLMEKAVKALKRIASQKQTTDETEHIMSSPAMVEILKQDRKA